jgi:hypothetical protein
VRPANSYQKYPGTQVLKFLNFCLEGEEEEEEEEEKSRI